MSTTVTERRGAGHCAPARLVDLSGPTESSPSEATPVVVVLNHSAGATVLGAGQLAPSDFPDGQAISNETVTLTTHTGTHVDAPLDYGPRTGGAPARSIDEVPLDWCRGLGVRLDLRHLPPGTGIGVRDLAVAVDRVGRTLEPRDIVLLWTGAGRLWDTPEYLTDFPGLNGPGTWWLLGHGKRVIGIDAWGMDRPMAAMVDDYLATGDRDMLRPSHMAGRDHEYLQLEKLANLDAQPGATGFLVTCFPVRVTGAGAAWTRVVAHLLEPEAGS